MAARIRVALAEEDGLATLQRLVATTPALRSDDMYGELHGLLVEHGNAPLF